jgi:hypothetical protein
LTFIHDRRRLSQLRFIRHQVRELQSGQGAQAMIFHGRLVGAEAHRLRVLRDGEMCDSALCAPRRHGGAVFGRSPALWSD